MLYVYCFRQKGSINYIQIKTCASHSNYCSKNIPMLLYFPNYYKLYYAHLVFSIKDLLIGSRQVSENSELFVGT